ncbi:STAS domain-containing protein [Geodermatophilus marinus]|uniref:STAS domain-containing protein n=1 Tax=Geodermatophilus sp. LHW52908 TaxID=2303986 RepID=UPI000E3E4489|nr:STAS domain-containing protein [Geodermatophilus sp. LHW52908]RFU21217.1 anti-sigma factor antagonist [Geodermatophilus sp. LHW52908]
MTVTSSIPGDDLVSVAVSGNDTALHLTVAGEVDSSTAPALRAALDEALDRAPRQVVVDLDAVSFLDSAGLCVLASAHRRATERGLQLRVLASGSAVIRPLQITGLWDLLSVERVDPGTGSAA